MSKDTNVQLKIAIQEQLDNSNILGAEKLLQTWQETALQQDYLAQKQFFGKICLFRGQYLRALDYFQLCSRIESEKIEVLSDLALCYFQLGLQSDLEEILSKIRIQIEKQLPRLNSTELLNNTIFCSKLLEECGHLLEAVEILNYNKNEDLNYSQNKVLLIQRLRLKTLLRQRDEVETLYFQVTSSIDKNLNFEIEREHALLHADYFLFGFKAAKSRYLEICQQPLSLADQSFILTEYLEMLILCQNIEALGTVNLDIASDSEYEKTMIKMVKTFLLNEKVNFQILSAEKKFTKLSLLRLIRIFTYLFPNEAVTEENIKRTDWHLAQIKIPQITTQFRILKTLSSRQEVVLSKLNQQIQFQNIKHQLHIDFFWKLIALMKLGQISLTEIAKNIYREELNSQHYDRVRMSIYRINKEIENICGLVAFLKVTKSQVSFRKNIEVTINEN